MSIEDSYKSVTRSATHFLTGTFISRFTGMIRDMSMAFFFGTSVAVAAFMVAFRLANLLRRLFGEGALLNGFIPFFESIRKDSPEEGAAFFRDLFFSLAAFLSIVIFVLEGGIFFLGKLHYISQDTKEILYLTMLMLPGLVFICLFGLTSALLECEKNFFTPGIAPVAFNIVWICAVWLSYHLSPYEAMARIAHAIVLAFFFQWVVTLPGVFRYLHRHLQWRTCLSPRLFNSGLSQMISPLLLGVIGVAAVQVNSAFDVIIARFSTLTGPAYLSYAHRLQQLPLALFGIAISSALMPPLSRAIKKNNEEKYLQLMIFGFSRTFSLLMPTTIAIFVLGASSVNLLYGRGNFDEMSTLQTTLCLWGYGVGLIPSAFVLLLAPAFYAKQDFWTPTKGSIIAVLCNALLNSICVFVLHLGPLSIALATSISAFLNMGYLLKQERLFVLKSMVPSFMKTSMAATAAGGMALLIGTLLSEPTLQIMLGVFDGVFARILALQILQFTLLVISYTGFFVLFSFLLKADGVLDLFRLLKKTSF